MSATAASHTDAAADSRRFVFPRALTAPKSARSLYIWMGVAWMATRALVLVHQGQWPWMNSFVVDTARDMLDGNWDAAVRPPLPSVLAMPFVTAGVDDFTTIFVLYLAASLIQYGAFVLFVRQLFPDRLLEQMLSLLLFVVVPFHHSIHHWRNVPVVLATSGLLLVAAHWLRAMRHLPDARLTTPGSLAWLVGGLALGAWSRLEVVVFAVTVAGLGLLVYRRRAALMLAVYAASTLLIVGASTAVSYATRPAETQLYQVHTFLDSTPASWLTEECRNYPSENCREQDGWRYFGPEDRNAGLLTIIARHPWTTVAKTWQSAIDNLWGLFGVAGSVYPGYAWLAIAAVLGSATCRQALRSIPATAWIVAAGAMAVIVLPPLAWAPSHPQYHLHSFVAVVVVGVPLLARLLKWAKGERIVLGFFAVNVLLSAFRYTRYPGY